MDNNVAFSKAKHNNKLYSSVCSIRAVDHNLISEHFCDETGTAKGVRIMEVPLYIWLMQSISLLTAIHSNKLYA